MHPENINPIQWQQSIGLARQICARIFRDGGRPEDALRAVGFHEQHALPLDWSRAVERVAEVLCTEPLRRAA